MLKYNKFAFLNLENQIYQGFQTPAGPINLKPLQGLKHPSIGGNGNLAGGPINLKPLQGLKRRWRRPCQSRYRGPINLKPLQRLKHLQGSLITP